MRRSMGTKEIVKLFSTAVMAMALLAPMMAHADRTIGEFRTGSFFDTGGCFSRFFNRGIGVGLRGVHVQQKGWDLRYASTDHHIRRAHVRISNVAYNSFTGNLSFRVSGCFYDRNADDDFFWQVWYAVLAEI